MRAPLSSAKTVTETGVSEPPGVQAVTIPWYSLPPSVTWNKDMSLSYRMP